MTTLNVYCDESCHLEHDREPVMLIGSICCPLTEVKRISAEIRALKKEHNANGELKWNKVSKARTGFYLQLLDLFFREPHINFRCIVVDDKSKLNHDYFNTGSHDSFYYKMYFYMLKNILERNNQYRIFIDIKDTKGQRKVEKLKNILCNTFQDFSQEMIANAQQIRSHESELLQLADFLIGAVGYKNRKRSGNAAKEEIVKQLISKAQHPLDRTSAPWEKKFNIFLFTPQTVR